MNQRRVKQLRREAEAAGYKLTKRGFRQLKEAYHRDPKIDIVATVRELRRSDILRAVQRMTPSQRAEFVRKYAETRKAAEKNKPVDTGKTRGNFGV